MAPVTLPVLTWEFSGVSSFASDNVIAGMAALAALITASSNWRVIAGGNGTTDDYLEVGGLLTGPNPNARYLFGGNPNAAAASQPALANRGIEQPINLSNTQWWCCYAPDDGRTVNPWGGAGAVYSNRNTGFMAVASSAFQSVKCWSNEEELIVMLGYTNVWAYTEFVGWLSGATIVAPRTDDAEADERVRTLQVQYTPLAFAGSGLSNFWGTNAPPFSQRSPIGNPNSKAVMFDPVNPNTLMAICMPDFAVFPPTGTSNKALGGGEIHVNAMFISRDMGAGPGANASPASPNANEPDGEFVIGAWRQMRHGGPQRVGDLTVFDPPGPANIISYTISRVPTSAFDCVYLDNQ